ncbi:MAG: NUDIX domain-containing protein [Symploca sp. SIO2E6]|nr:NUDIX domain-containing protein [Symploca sp. SIO2E6]
MNDQPIEVAIAILYTTDQFLLQLRDNIPGIVYPGCWGLFGGHLEAGEVPEAAVKRELIEEINYSPPSVAQFRSYVNADVIRHVYHAPLTVKLNQLVLGEGLDMGLLTLEEIRQGKGYSEKADQVRPLGSIHQQILLDFIDSTIHNSTI